jgi:hypothetical protein
MKSADVGYFDENGNWNKTDEKVAVNNEKPAPSRAPAATTTAPQSTTARATTTEPPASTARSTTTAKSTTASSNRATGTSGAGTSRRQLPRTASGLELYELLSALSLAGGFTLRAVRR